MSTMELLDTTTCQVILEEKRQIKYLMAAIPIHPIGHFYNEYRLKFIIPFSYLITLRPKAQKNMSQSATFIRIQKLVNFVI